METWIERLLGWFVETATEFLVTQVTNAIDLVVELKDSALVCVLVAAAVVPCWNHTVHVAFGGPELTFWTSLLLVALSRLFVPPRRLEMVAPLSAAELTALNDGAPMLRVVPDDDDDP